VSSAARRQPEIVRLDLNDQVYESIKARLLTRDFGGGQKISLQTLADELGVSRSPVHHALTRLTSEGLIDSEPRGYVVRPLTADLMDELYDARLALELHAARLTVGKITDDELEQFRALLEETLAPVSGKRMTNPSRYVQANRAFHEFQVDLAKNSTISQMYRRLCVFQLQERAMLMLGVSAAGSSSNDHRAIVRAYERGDVAAACAALETNLETGRQISRAAIEHAGGVI
jgi:DNA-binding GntR family transcriptional regulator